MVKGRWNPDFIWIPPGQRGAITKRSGRFRAASFGLHEPRADLKLMRSLPYGHVAAAPGHRLAAT
jgi:hypothetical protein